MPGKCTDNSLMMPGFYVKKKKVCFVHCGDSDIVVSMLTVSSNVIRARSIIGEV